MTDQEGVIKEPVDREAVMHHFTSNTTNHKIPNGATRSASQLVIYPKLFQYKQNDALLSLHVFLPPCGICLDGNFPSIGGCNKHRHYSGTALVEIVLQRTCWHTAR